ncbi:MAG: hypothetical protein AAF726_17820 [Planctomycetota bacterium]
MSDSTISLQRSRAAAARADAWLVAGRDPRAWLAALAELHVPLDRLELYVVPDTNGERAPAALLVVAPEDAAPPSARHGAQPLARSGAVLLPVDGTMEPPPTNTERDRLFALPLHLLHPRFGHVGFESSDRIRARDLLVPPPLVSSTWSSGRPGISLPRSIGPFGAIVSETDLERFIAEGREEIGVDPIERLDDRGPLRAASDLAGAAFLRLPNRLLARAALWYAKRVPETAERPTFVDRLARWAGNVLASDGDGRRAREVRRLIELLRDDPDRGLRHAIPMGGNPFDRGRGFGSDRLGDRTPDFDLDQLGGGRGVDAWAIGAAQRRVLERLYRERALADAAAGRHRRAAYVYARLLGDLRSAARVLEDGGHYREAARLWRDHLDEPAEAARCLEKGGLFEDALSIHRDRKDHEAEARLLHRIGRRAEAREAWRRVVDDCLQRADVLSAAKVLERSLNEPDEAARVLRAAWPAGRRPEASLDAWFELCDRRGRSGDLRAWIAEERGRALVDGRSLQLLRQLGRRCGSLSDEATRAELADALRCAVGSTLTGEVRLPMDEVRERLQALGPIAPADRVFASDLQRFQGAAARRDAKRPDRPRTAARGTIRTLATFTFTLARADEEQSFFLGTPHGLWVGLRSVRKRRIRIEEHDWTGRRIDHAEVSGVAASVERCFVPRWSPKGASPLVLTRAGDRLGGRVRSVSGAGRLSVATPSTLPDGTVDAVDDGNGELWVLQVTPERRLRLTRFDRDGRTLEDEDVGPRPGGGPLRVARVGRGPAVVHLDGVLRLGVAGPPFTVRLAREWFEVASSPPGSTGRALVVSDSGARLLTDDRGILREVLLSKERDARAAFTRDGAITIADGTSVRLLRTRDREAHLVARAPAGGGGARSDVLAVVPARQPDHFAVVRSDGTVTVYTFD